MGGGADGLALVRHLIDRGADPNSRNDEGYSPLHYAATVEIAEALVELGADVNAAGFLCGRTPLHIHSLKRGEWESGEVEGSGSREWES